MAESSKGTYYPPVAFYFQLSFSGKERNAKIAFKEVSGISMKMNTEEITEGGEDRFKYRVPTRIKYDNLILKRGMASSNSECIKWVRETLESNLSQSIKPKTIALALLNEKGNPLKSWRFENAYPVKWNVSNFNSMGNEIVIETLEFAYTNYHVIP